MRIDKQMINQFFVVKVLRLLFLCVCVCVFTCLCYIVGVKWEGGRGLLPIPQAYMFSICEWPIGEMCNSSAQ